MPCNAHPHLITPTVGATLSLSPRGKDSSSTLVITSDVYVKHKTGRHCLECPVRIELISGVQGILRTGTMDDDALLQLKFEPCVNRAKLSDILRVHEWSYIHTLMKACENAALSGRKAMWIDPPGHPRDTMVSPESYHVAEMGAGAGESCENITAPSTTPETGNPNSES